MDSKYSGDNEYEYSRVRIEAPAEDTDAATTFFTNYASNAGLLSGKPLTAQRASRITQRFRRWFKYRRRPAKVSRSRGCTKRSLFRRFTLLSYSFLAAVTLITITAFTFFPSYTYLPSHYAALRARVQGSPIPGIGNPFGQKVFIAASLYDPDGKLASGRWANNVLDLIQLLGPENTFLSIYVNDSGPDGETALINLRDRVPCQHSLVYDEHLGLEGLPQVTLPDGSRRVKRIAYLAEVRNRALAPLELSSILYDKLLYLNDVVFDPIDALQLLFSTNQNKFGQADYRAACAVDFIMPFKFYDTFATRDLGGYQMGTPFFPWFAYGGDSRSHNDVVEGKDAVRVKSCWGGMVAYDARFFQKQPSWSAVPETAASVSPSNLTAPYRFRAETDMFWDASECCLIQADIQSPDPDNPGIYMNPYVRVAYGTKTLAWLWLTRRIEALYTPIHFLVDIMVSMPRFNPRRDERAWESVDEVVWIPDPSSFEGGAFQNVSRTASHTGYCGRRALPVMKSQFTQGEKNYEFIPIPDSYM